jgi:hypothetical protein
MNLADMLSFADIHQLHRIANYYACECNTNSKRDLIQSILDKMNRREVFENYIEQLPVEDIRFLNSLLFDPRDSFSLEDLLARAQISRFDSSSSAVTGNRETNSDMLAAASLDLKRESAAKSANSRKKEKKPPKTKTEENITSPREMVLKFAHQGWLFHGYSNQTKYLYQIPSDLKRRFGESLKRAFERQLRFSGEPEAYRDEQGLLAEDIRTFLRHLYHRPVELTAEGVMYKRSQIQIYESFHVKEEPVGKGGWRFGYGRKMKDYPNRFSLIYDYCYYSGWIAEQERELVLTEQGEAFVSEGRVPDLRDVYQFWLKLYKNPIPNLQSIVQWIERLAAEWVTLESLTAVLTKLIKPYYYDTPESILQNRIVMMMMHQGLLRIGEKSQMGSVVQMTKLGTSIIKGVYVPEEDRIALPEETIETRRFEWRG